MLRLHTVCHTGSYSGDLWVHGPRGALKVIKSKKSMSVDLEVSCGHLMTWSKPQLVSVELTKDS